MDAKITQLNLEKLALTLIKVPAVSLLANHKHIKSTMKDYVLPGDDALEAQFVRDCYVLTTEEIVEKWYGGKENAYALISK